MKTPYRMKVYNYKNMQILYVINIIKSQGKLI